jgi:hypothetical protein
VLIWQRIVYQLHGVDQGGQVESALAKPDFVQVLKARKSIKELARE